MRLRLTFILCLALLPACVSHRTAPPKPGTDPFTTSQLGKADLDRVTEAHQQEIFASLRSLAEKLYRRPTVCLLLRTPRGVAAGAKSQIPVSVPFGRTRADIRRG